MTEEYTVDINSANHADIWDDSLLIKAYNESLQLGKEQVAKAIARNTNNRQQKLQTQSESESSLASDREQINKKDGSFKVSDYVRVTYDDGIDYEARIITIDESDNTCLIKYLGYDNEQVVSVTNLLPSWGKKSRKKQICAAVDNNVEMITDENDGASLRNGKKPAKRIRKYHHAKMFDRNREHNNYHLLPPPPTPPMPPMLDDSVADPDLSAMLMSWYMSGYYTGLYQGRRQTKSHQHKNNTK